jgi:hypothetical protein
MALKERDCAAQEADRDDGLLVAENLGVHLASGAADRDVHVLPADDLTFDAVLVDVRLVKVALDAGDPPAGAAMDATKLLDVDVDQLARDLALAALRWLQPEPSEAANADPREDPESGRSRISAISGPAMSGHVP